MKSVWNCAVYFVSSAGLNPRKIDSLARSASEGKISGLLARSGSVFA